jgi:hypothetical protein
MKKLIILALLTITSCTTVRRDNHSYTYIHNFNSSSSEEKPARQFKEKREDIYPSDDFPQYGNGLGQTSAVIDNDIDIEPIRPSTGVTHNHYYPQRRAATYNPPPSYSGFAPSARRYLLHGETR